ncbi:MAG: hypothetical protein CSA07_00940 [Bacteroidia bacterium]|nr:MAG: hypothetical protein CSA07_00940 [Bacteroidia bacterium]
MIEGENNLLSGMGAQAPSAKPREALDILALYFAIKGAEVAIRDALGNVLNKGETRGMDFDAALVLLAVARLGYSNMTELATTVERDMPYVSREVSGLVARGLVTRQSGAQDAREKYVAITPSGAAIIDEVEAAFELILRRACSSMSHFDRQALIGLLAGVVADLRRR